MPKEDGHRIKLRSNAEQLNIKVEEAIREGLAGNGPEAAVALQEANRHMTTINFMLGVQCGVTQFANAIKERQG